MKRVFVIVALLSGGCTVKNAIGDFSTLTREPVDQCITHCESVGLDLAAFVLIMDHAGCVCEPRERAASGRAGAAAAGGAAIQMVVQQQQQQQQQQQRAMAR